LAFIEKLTWEQLKMVCAKFAAIPNVNRGFGKTAGLV
jgi:hypothetical protein